MKILQNSGVPIYQQISDQFKEDILAGKLPQGEYLPSIRSLAKDLKISVITTMKAYEQLEAEGLVTAVQGKGFYVCEYNTDYLKEKQLVMLEKRLGEIIAEAKGAGLSLAELVEMMNALYESGE